MRATLLVVVLAGCVSGGVPVPVLRWSRPGTAQPDFMRDRYRCLQEAQQQEEASIANRRAAFGQSQQTTNAGLFVACMEAMGYTRDPNGGLAPPPDSTILAR